MTEILEEQLERVEALLDSAQPLADPSTALGQQARRLLPRSTGLSDEGVDYALRHCLEVSASKPELTALCQSVTSAPKVHVLLSANVFVAPLRALALAFASSERVAVRPSRREPHFVRLLQQACSLPLEVMDDLLPSPREHVWAYGRDETLAKIKGDLPSGVVFFAHGSGFGAAVIDLEHLQSTSDCEQLAQRFALDIAAFDQQGCLSPRIGVLLGKHPEQFARLLSKALARLEHDMPQGEMSDSERADSLWYKDTFAYAGALYTAGKGFVGLDSRPERVIVPPATRIVHLSPSQAPAELLAPLSAHLTTLGFYGTERLRAELQRAFPHARVSELGSMQRPPLDGPIDRRASAQAEVL